jgi:hypothetical protein
VSTISRPKLFPFLDISMKIFLLRSGRGGAFLKALVRGYKTHERLSRYLSPFPRYSRNKLPFQVLNPRTCMETLAANQKKAPMNVLHRPNASEKGHKLKPGQLHFKLRNALSFLKPESSWLVYLRCRELAAACQSKFQAPAGRFWPCTS